MQLEKKFEHVTNRQGVQLADFARKEGVSREKFAEFLKDEEMKKKFFQELMNGNDWFAFRKARHSNRSSVFLNTSNFAFLR